MSFVELALDVDLDEKYEEYTHSFGYWAKKVWICI
jgi:hypothetical protein